MDEPILEKLERLVNRIYNVKTSYLRLPSFSYSH
jgi:hypothetical protein